MIDTVILENEFIHNLSWTIIHFIWQAFIVVIIFECISKVFSRLSAQFRYLLASLTLVCLCVLPVITFLSIAKKQTIEIAISKNHKIENTKSKTVHLTNNRLYKTQTNKGLTNLETNSGQLSIWVAEMTSKIESYFSLIAPVWMLGVVGFSIYFLGGWLQLQHLRRDAIQLASAELQDKTVHLCKLLGVHKAILLYQSTKVVTPMVMGHFKPIIIFPASVLSGLSKIQIESLIVHELAHIKRYDYIVNILQTMVEVLGFFHPAVWWISKVMREEREHCCDDISIQLMGDHKMYSEALISIAELQLTNKSFAIAASDGSLQKRIRRIYSIFPQRSHLNWIQTSLFLVCIICLIMLTSDQTMNAESASKPLNKSVQIDSLDKNSIKHNDDVVRAETNKIQTKQDNFDLNDFEKQINKFHLNRKNEETIEAPSFVFTLPKNSTKKHQNIKEKSQKINNQPKERKDKQTASKKLKTILYDLTDLLSNSTFSYTLSIYSEMIKHNGEVEFKDFDKPKLMDYNSNLLIKYITSIVDPSSWENKEIKIIVPEPGKLQVSQYLKSHEQINTHLEQILKLQIQQISVEVHLITSKSNDFSDIGIEWKSLQEFKLQNSNITTQNSDMIRFENPINHDLDSSLERNGTELSRSPFRKNMNTKLAILNSNKAAVILNTLYKNKKASVIIAPRLTVLNNHQGYFKRVQNSSYISRYEIQNETLEPIVEMVSVGEIVAVKPMISRDQKHITIELGLQLTRNLKFETRQLQVKTKNKGKSKRALNLNIKSPIMDIWEATTRVQVSNDDVVAVCGKFVQTASNQAQKTSHLSNIPLLGKLFRKKSNKSKSDHFLMFVKTKIISFGNPEIQKTELESTRAF